jgi:cobalt-zinc-cadmium efflux system membrane fusion protein
VLLLLHRLIAPHYGITRISLFSGAGLLLASLTGLLAHEGHDHGPPLAEIPANTAVRAEAVSDHFELVAVAGSAEILIYLDRFDSNAPVENARIEAETPEGTANAVFSGGIYRLPAPWLARQEKADLVFSVTAGETNDILALTLPTAIGISKNQSIDERPFRPSLLIAGMVGFVLGCTVMAFRHRWRRKLSSFAAMSLFVLCGFQARAAEENSTAVSVPIEHSQRMADGTVFVPKSVQRIFGVRTWVAETALHRRVLELPGRIIPDPNASGFVQAAIGGRLSPPRGGFPRLGTQVKKGDVLAYVTPPLQAIDVSDMRQRQGELDQQIAIVERRLARYETLASTGAVSRTQLEDTKLELEGLKIRRASLDQVRQEPEALLAPVDGVVAEGSPVAGQVAQTNAVIFHVIDPGRMWVEALSFDPMTGAETASANTVSGKQISLSYRGAGLADRNQSIPVHFAIDGDSRELRAGQLVTVIVTTNQEKQGIAVPRASVVRGANGQDFVYAHISAERFVARPVRAEPLDGDRMLLLTGVEPGQRIVMQGAELLDQVR